MDTGMEDHGVYGLAFVLWALHFVNGAMGLAGIGNGIANHFTSSKIRVLVPDVQRRDEVDSLTRAGSTALPPDLRSAQTRLQLQRTTTDPSQPVRL